MRHICAYPLYLPGDAAKKQGYRHYKRQIRQKPAPAEERLDKLMY
jgi:hypothetical protein